MIDSVVEEQKNYRDDVNNEIQHCSDITIRISKNVHIEPIVPRLAKRWSKYGLNFEVEGQTYFCKRTKDLLQIALIFM